MPPLVLLPAALSLAALRLTLPVALAIGVPGSFGAPDPAGDLVTAAAASARPTECSARAQSGRAPSIWERARTPQRAAYCTAIAQSHARLGADPRAAEEAADRAEQAWPGRPATRVARARARLARGDVTGALAAFEEAQRMDPRAVSDPASLRDLARARARGGQLEGALAVYRALVPQSSLLPRDTQAAVLVEASLAAMAAPRAAGPAADAAVTEALAFLREARSLGPSSILAEAALVLALTLDRAGDATGSAAQLAEAMRLGASGARAAQLVADPADAAALAALASESADRGGAASLWDRYLAEARGGAFRGAAERRRDALRGGAAPGAQAAPPARRPARRAPRP